MAQDMYNEARDILEKRDFGFDAVFSLSKICSSLLDEKETENFGRDIVIRVLDLWKEIPSTTHDLWNDLIEAAGLYPYTNPDKLSGGALLRQEFHRSAFLQDKFLHSEQMSLSNLLIDQDRSLIVSAPTSFGKSLLIEELVASKKYKNIVIIQPTLALLDETRKKLQKYSEEYNLIVSTTQAYDQNGKNLFLFTGERVVEYPEFPSIDFFIVDEFYKLSMDRDDERATSLNEAVYRLLKMTSKFYMLGPNIKNIPEGFSKTYEAHWEKTTYATVAVDIEKLFERIPDSNQQGYTFVPLDKDKVLKIETDDHLWNQIFTGSEEGGFFLKSGAREVIESLSRETHKSIKTKLNNIYKRAEEQSELFGLLVSLKEPTLIYCQSPMKTFQVANNFVLFLKNRGIEDLYLPESDQATIDWIEENIDGNWVLAKALEYSTGIHNGIIPRHLSSAIVDSFNTGKIRYLFCTSTLIEGVNTSAKNVVLLDKKKGPKPIDYFDFKNIAGRTGRMNQHFVGRVFQFHEEPKQVDIEVDIPLFTQEHAPVELLVQIEPKDIKEVAEKKLEKFKELDIDVQELLKSNKGVPIEGQLKIIEILKKDIDSKYDLVKWTGFPKFEPLKYVIELGWNHLLQKGESKGGVRSAAQLATLTLQYCQHKSPQALIKANYNSEFWKEKIPNDDERLQHSINTTLQATQHWFNYKLPKVLAVVSELQKFVCEKKGLKPGDYSVLAGTIENSFVPEHLAVLMEYGIPSSAINKISAYIKTELPMNELAGRLKKVNAEEAGLLPYEVRKIQSFVEGYGEL